MSQIDEQPTIKLSQHDLDKCLEFTDLYTKACKARNAQQKHGNFSVQKKHQQTLQGYLGERAVGLYFDYSTKYKPYNRTIADVLGYEVRTVKHGNKLLLTYSDDLDANYINVSINYETMTATLQGWSTLQRTFTKTNWLDGPQWHTPCYGMHENQLWPMHTLPATPELIAHQIKVYA